MDSKVVINSLGIIEVIDNLIQAIDNGEYAIGVSLNLSKVFDTVDHKIL